MLRVQHARLSGASARGYRLAHPSDPTVESWAMLARFPLEIHLWTIPLLFATGWVIGYAHFRDTLRRKHEDLFEEWRSRTTRKDEPE